MCNKQGGKNRSFRQKVGLKFMVFFFLRGSLPVFKVKLRVLFIFSGFCRQRLQGSPYESCQQLRFCSHTDSCAYQSNGEVRRTDSHSGSQNLKQRTDSVKSMTSVHSSKTPWTVYCQGQWRRKIITEDDVIRLYDIRLHRHLFAGSLMQELVLTAPQRNFCY